MFQRTTDGTYLITEGLCQGLTMYGSVKEGGFYVVFPHGSHSERKRTRAAALEAASAKNGALFTAEEYANGIDTLAKRKKAEQTEAPVTMAADKHDAPDGDTPELETIKLTVTTENTPEEPTAPEEPATVSDTHAEEEAPAQAEDEAPRLSRWTRAKLLTSKALTVLATVLATLLYPLVRLGDYGAKKLKECLTWFVNKSPRKHWMIAALFGIGVLAVTVAILMLAVAASDALEKKAWRYR